MSAAAGQPQGRKRARSADRAADANCLDRPQAPPAEPAAVFAGEQYGTPAAPPAPRREADSRPMRAAAESGAQLLGRLVGQQVRAARAFFAPSHGATRPAEAGAELQERRKRLKARWAYCFDPNEGEAPAPLSAARAAAGSTKMIAGPSGAGGAVARLPKVRATPDVVTCGSKEQAAAEETRRKAKKKEDLQVLNVTGSELRRMHEKRHVRPAWHAPWQLLKVIAGHLGWVRCIAVDWTNEWFISSGADRALKIWDLASGRLKLTLTGHISTVRGVCISQRSPYAFTCSEDGQVKCWDLEVNKAVRSYHGHLNGVYSVALHPTLDILASGGRDAAVRLWDVRSRAQIHCMTGHESTVASLAMQASEPQIISGSHDTMIRLWDITAGRTRVTLTHHKKSVRALAVHPSDYCFVSGAPDNIKKWKCPDGEFMDNFSGQRCIVNAVACNSLGVLASGGDNGSLHFWDWRTGHNFQQMQTIAQPGSLASEAGVYCTTFDQSGTRLLTGEADKTIKIWREDPNATPETHPLNWQPSRKQ